MRAYIHLHFPHDVIYSEDFLTYGLDQYKNLSIGKTYQVDNTYQKIYINKEKAFKFSSFQFEGYEAEYEIYSCVLSFPITEEFIEKYINLYDDINIKFIPDIIYLVKLIPETRSVKIIEDLESLI